MNKILFGFIISFSLILLLAAVIGGIVIYNNNQEDLLKISTSATDRMTYEIGRSIETGSYPGTEQFGKLADSFFRRYKTLCSIAVYSVTDGVYYLKAGSPGIVQYEKLDFGSWSGKIPYNTSMEKEIFQVRDLRISGMSDKLKFETSFAKSLTPSNYKISLTLFFVITALLVFTIFALIFAETEKTAAVTGNSKEGAYRSPENKPEKDVQSEKEPVPLNETAPEPEQLIIEKPSALKRDEVKQNSETPAAVPEDTEQQAFPQAEKSTQFCLYSEKTGFVKQELLSDKLDQELKRSASFDQDLVFAVFSFKGLTDSNLADFQSIISEHFPYKDLIFEYENNSFALIIPNIDLESSVDVMENFQIKIEKTIHTENQKFCAGISSRSGRLLTGDRILLEAARSHERARSDKTGGIILFRISPRKYRQVIADKNV